MASKESFDITTGVDLQEIDNAVNQTLKELTTRYDFKAVKFSVDFDRKEATVDIRGPDAYKVNAIWDVLQGKLIRRNVPLKNVKPGKIEDAAAGTVRQKLELVQGLSSELAREIVKAIKEAKLKRVQATIMEDQVRVSGPKRDDLQEVIHMLKDTDFGVELKFGNYRST
jgi:uncharacterized protein YajQ (UPF0234 family)